MNYVRNRQLGFIVETLRRKFWNIFQNSCSLSERSVMCFTCVFPLCVFNAIDNISKMTVRWYLDACVVIQKWLSIINHTGSGIRTIRNVVSTDRWWLLTNILIWKWRAGNQIKSPRSNTIWLHFFFFSFRASKTCGKIFRCKPHYLVFSKLDTK